MRQDQYHLLKQARESLDAARLLDSEGFYGFAASRAYYTMFYVAEAFLLGKELTFSKHSGVHAAFGQHFVKTGVVSPELHSYLIRGMEVRHTGDYEAAEMISPEEAAEQIRRAEEFLQEAERIIGPMP